MNPQNIRIYAIVIRRDTISNSYWLSATYHIYTCCWVIISYWFNNTIFTKYLPMDWIGLHLFNDDTRSSGRISRPSQVGFSHSCLCSINEFPSWCSVVGINSTLECRQLVTNLNEELYWIYGHSYQLIDSSFFQKLFNASLRDRLKGGPQLCSTHHDFVATLYVHGICIQWSEYGHNAGKKLMVLWTSYGILSSWYGQYGVGLSQPPQLWSGAEISCVVLVLVSGDTDLYHVQTHLTKFGPTVECTGGFKSAMWTVVSGSM